MQLLVVAIQSLIEVAIVEAWMFLLKAIGAGSKMMLNFFSFEGERDERQRRPTGHARIYGQLNFGFEINQTSKNSFTNANLY